MIELDEDEHHRRRSETLVDSLMNGTSAEVIYNLCKMDRLDGEAFKILVWNLTKKTPSEYKFRNQFRIVGTRGRPRHPLSEPGLQRVVYEQFLAWRKKGLSHKAAMHKAELYFKMKRSKIAFICAQEKKKKKLAKTSPFILRFHGPKICGSNSLFVKNSDLEDSARVRCGYLKGLHDHPSNTMPARSRGGCLPSFVHFDTSKNAHAW